MKIRFLNAIILKRPFYLKLSMIMKTGMLLTFVGVTQLFATGHTQEKLTINVKQSTVSYVLNKLQQESTYRFFYNSAVLDPLGKVDIAVKDKELTQVLDQLLGNTVPYEVLDKNVVLIGKQENRQQAIKGRVLDESGSPLSGVSVRIQGNKQGTSTDNAGAFSLPVTVGAQLEFSYMGYEKQVISIGNQTTLTVTLKMAAEGLNEVVVVGYSTQRKADLTGAVSSMNMESVKNTAVTGVEHALEGKMAGVTVLQNSGAPGASASVRIRGIGTLGNNNPLYILDGVPVNSMNDVDPSSIEKIDVLKDAASAAIYGSRAANGVVIITTKKGISSDKVNISFNTQQGFQSPTGKIDMLNAVERNQVHMQAYRNSGLNVPAYYGTPEAQITATDWQDEIFKNAYTASYDIGFSGGSNTAKYNIMASHFDNNGFLKNTNFKRTSFRVNTELNLAKNLKIGENLMLSVNDNKAINTTSDYSGALYSALLYQPDIPVYTSTGELSGVGALGGDVENPVGIINRADDKTDRKRVIGNVFAEWNVVDHLTFRSDFGYDYTNAVNKVFSPRIPEAGRKNDVNTLYQVTEQTTHWISTNTLKYDNMFGKHHLMALGGMAVESNNYLNDNQRASGFISEDERSRYFSNATTIISMYSGREEWGLISYFGRLDYSFNDRYLLAGNLRADGSSKFAKNNRWGVFPSVSGGWRISEEPFFEGAKHAFNNLKLRGSWGQLGNQNIYDNYPTYSIIRNNTDNDGYYSVFGEGETPTLGRFESNIPNPDIKWEVTTQWNVGFDMGFLNNNLEVVMDYYNKTTSDILLQVPITSLAGVTTAPWVNAGKVENKGFEAAVTYHKQDGDFKYDIGANFATLTNKVLALGASQAIYGSTFRGNTLVRTTTGLPIGYFYGYKTAGLFQSDAEVNSYVNANGQVYQPSAVAGDVKFVDIDGNGVINADDRTNLGSGFPKLTYGLNFNASYKHFDLSMSWYGVGGNKILNATKWTGIFVDPHYNQYADILNAWSPENTDTAIPRLSITDPNGNQQISDIYVESGNYLRLRNLTLGYTLPKFSIRKIAVNNLRIYLTGQNLLTFTKYSGIDPEIGETFPASYGNNEIGVNRGQYPQAKTFIMGINLSL
ncbi:SusC/RagA family TonB-linked outer membrane protein [Olivibacter domesticus]|nr:TonB-dependent receptor [Olivibacter domesticus]